MPVREQASLVTVKNGQVFFGGASNGRSCSILPLPCFLHCGFWQCCQCVQGGSVSIAHSYYNIVATFFRAI